MCLASSRNIARRHEEPTTEKPFDDKNPDSLKQLSENERAHADDDG